MYKAKPFLDKYSLLSLYFSYIQSYKNYANLARASTHKTNLNKFSQLSGTCPRNRI